ncbi:hypothetical protein [Nitrosomonas sp. JL21]|nr:hypothetical protein [Nitrosomonas sp. JL21]
MYKCIDALSLIGIEGVAKRQCDAQIATVDVGLNTTNVDIVFI